MEQFERIPIVLVDSTKSACQDFRTCLAGSRFKVWTDTQYSDHLLPLYRTLSPRLVVVDMAATPQAKGGPGAIQAIEQLMKVEPTACVIVSSDVSIKYMLNAALAAGARCHILRPYTVEGVLAGIGTALANPDPSTARRRGAIRVPARLDFFYKEPTGKAWNPTRIVHTEDVSESGARVRLERTFPEGEELKVALRMQEQAPPMWMRARVAHCGPTPGNMRFDLGLEFVEMEEGHRSVLRGYVREQIANGLIA